MPRRVGSLDPPPFCALTLSKHLGEHLIAYTKTILNLVYALGSSLLLMLLGFATRRLLVFNFGNDITAASQVVDKLFNFFSIAEFGVGSVISYRLYEQIAAKDTEKISKYMSMYKWAYRAVGVVICVLAGIGALALPWIMPGVASIQTAYTVYLLNTISTLSGYFLVTRRLMYTCTQQGTCVPASTSALMLPTIWPALPLRCGCQTIFCISRQHPVQHQCQPGGGSAV